jgi:thioredoxin-like negative regulator of GroEL
MFLLCLGRVVEKSRKEVGRVRSRRGSDGQAGKPRLVFFYSRRSGRSRRAEGFLAQVLQRRHNFENFELFRVDTSERADLSKRLAVERVPTLVVLEGKRVSARIEEPRGCADIEEALRPWLK